MWINLFEDYFFWKRVKLFRFNITLNWNLGGSLNHFSIMLMKADRNNYIKNYWYVNCIECELDNDEIYYSSIIKHCLLPSNRWWKFQFENFEILNQFTIYVKCICFFNHSYFKTVYNFLSFVYDSWTQALKILQSSSCYRHVNLY